MAQIEQGLRMSILAMLINGVLSIAKIITGIIGNSYALVADGIESTADLLSSAIVWGGLKVSAKPPDEEHPFGHGRAETIAGIVVSLLLLASAVLIATMSIREIKTPHHAPAPFTLVVLAVVIAVKALLARAVMTTSRSLESTALAADAWHHRSDALTSAGAFVGISIALIGGPGYESADDWAALAACGIIAWNSFNILGSVVDELMDRSVSPQLTQTIREMAKDVPGVVDIEKCRIRKAGLHLHMDIHVVVNANLTVFEGHEIGHRVKDCLLASQHRIRDVTVHVEPDSTVGSAT